jgi:hypothetical protein
MTSGMVAWRECGCWFRKVVSGGTVLAMEGTTCPECFTKGLTYEDLQLDLALSASVTEGPEGTTYDEF